LYFRDLIDENCEIKDSRIKELEVVVRKTTQLTPANQITEEKDNKIMQLQKELDKRTQELQCNQNGPIFSCKYSDTGCFRTG
jgi:hypothetical protein